MKFQQKSNDVAYMHAHGIQTIKMAYFLFSIKYEIVVNSFFFFFLFNLARFGSSETKAMYVKLPNAIAMSACVRTQYEMVFNKKQSVFIYEEEKIM